MRDDAVIIGGADRWTALALGPGRYRAEWVDILTGAVTTKRFESAGWIRKIRGVRRGGGAALRVFREDAPAR